MDIEPQQPSPAPASSQPIYNSQPQQPQPVVTIPTTVEQPKSKKKLILFLVLIIAVVGGAVAAYLLLFKPVSAQQLHRQVLGNSISLEEEEELHMSFDIKSQQFELQADMIGFAAKEDYRMKANFAGTEIDEDIDSIEIEMLIFQEGTSLDSYTQIKSITPQSILSDVLVGKWVVDQDQVADGFGDSLSQSLDSSQNFNLLVPSMSLEKAEQEIFFEVLDENNPYQVADEIEIVEFKGLQVRKIEITIEKQLFETYLDAVTEVLSDTSFGNIDSDMREEIIDTLFGTSDQFSFSLFVSEDGPEMVGMSFVFFDDSGAEANFTLFVDHSKALQIEPPEDALTLEELELLLSDSLTELLEED